MNRKCKINQYEVCVNFRSENTLSMAVEYLPTGQYFLNENVELMKIKKDTVFATLERKSQKNLTCEFQQFHEEGKALLMVSFVVNFDYLPEFREEIRLEFVEKNESLKNLKINNFQAEIEGIQQILNNYEKNGFTFHQAIGNISLNGKKTIWKKDLQKGKYLLKFCSIYTNSLGTASSDRIIFETLLPNKQIIKSETTSYNMSGYSYPISFSEILEIEEGECEMFTNLNMANGSLSNIHVVLNPIMQLN